LEEIERRGFR